MARLAIARYADILRYDADLNQLFVLDLASPPVLRPLDLGDLGGLRALARADSLAGQIGAGYALAQAAHAWAGRPTDARRGQLIQAAEALGDLLPLAGALDALREKLDAALLAGQDAAAVALNWADALARRADRAARRCGGHAASLVLPDDRVLTWGLGGLPLLALLAALPAAQPWPLLLAAGAQAGAAGLLALAVAAGQPAQPLPDIAALEAAGATLAIFPAIAVAEDGSAVCPAGAGAAIAHARSLAIPCYLLAPSGPDAAAFASASGDPISPAQIGAIVTDRGMYRPAMLSRYHGDAEAPLDVIPLS